MRKGRSFGTAIALTSLALAGLASSTAAVPAPATARVDVIRIDGSINPASAEFVVESLARSVETGASALVIELDTPGGLLSSTRTIVQALLGARIPVLVWVAPSGAGAGSAGVFIVMAANVAAMAPGTNIGASTPVQGGGADIEGAMGRKVKSFTASFAKAIAEQRGRNVEWAENAVRRASSVTDREALERNVIDLIAPDLSSLLLQASGREVEIGGSRRTLALAGARIERFEMRFGQKVLNFLGDPNVAYLFLLAGLLGLYLELSHPGTLFPGVTGAICLLIAMASFQILPINVTGLALVGLGVAMLIAELFLPSFGIVGVGGLVAFVLGSLFLFDGSDPGIVIDPWLIGSAASAVGVVMLTLATLVARSMRRTSSTGREGLIGARGEARSRVAPRGTVSVHGELWQARSEDPVEAGEPVVVIALEGLTLQVESLREGGRKK